MNSVQQFFHMDGYAFYVWTAFGTTLFVLGMNLFLALRRRAYIDAIISNRRRPAA